MSKKWFLWRTLGTLVVVGLLMVGGWAIYRASWAQGYAAGQLASGGEDVPTAPYPHYGFGHVGRPFGFAPFLFGAGLLLLLFVTAGTLFRFLTWGKVMVGGPWPMDAHWARHWQRFHGPVPHGPMPPWCWGWGEPPEKAEPDAETGAAEA